MTTAIIKIFADINDATLKLTPTDVSFSYLTFPYHISIISLQ